MTTRTKNPSKLSRGEAKAAKTDVGDPEETTPEASPPAVDARAPAARGAVLRKKELIAAVVDRSGVRKKDAKPVVESMLAVLGAALAENRELILPPLGKVKVRREKSLPNAQVMVVKLRRPKSVSSETSGRPPETGGHN